MRRIDKFLPTVKRRSIVIYSLQFLLVYFYFFFKIFFFIKQTIVELYQKDERKKSDGSYSGYDEPSIFPEMNDSYNSCNKKNES